MGEALPAVTVALSPLRNTVRRPASVSGVESPRTVSSRVSSTPFLVLGATLTVRSSYLPSSHALAASWWELAANASWSSREMPCFSRSCSVASPRDTVHSLGMSGFTRRQPRVVLASSRFCMG